jgi:outer membrane protein assembly factor BamB
MTGKATRKTRIPVYSKICHDDDTLYFQSHHDNERGYRIASISSIDGTRVWEQDVPFSKGDATFAPEPVGILGNQLIVRTHLGPIYGLDKASGKMLWRKDAAEVGGESFGVCLLFKRHLWVQVRHALIDLTPYTA